MLPVTDAPNGTLRWSIRPGRAYILEAGGQEAGRLAFTGKGGSLALGSTAHGEWTFKREGFLHPRITVRATGSESNCGSFTLSAGGNGKLALSWGEEFTFVTSGWLHSHWAFQRRAMDMVRFSRDGSSADVEIVNLPNGPGTLSILILLGWYAPLLAAEEAAVMVPLRATPLVIG